MEPTFVKRDAVVVAGVERTYEDPANATGFDELWQREFEPRYGEIAPLCEDKGFYGAWFGEPDGAAVYLAGAAVVDRKAVPDGFAVREIPGGRYAAFACTVATIGPTYGRIFGEWLPQNPGVMEHERPHFEYYPPGTTAPDSPVQILVPVAPDSP
ncbi:MAG: GyrI-like domain-containing protein [Candidatus Eisenbacteria bacterium]|nr:GyrI-like domain-containing protein [Candidatus Eisenbacteria bacterium]